ncbi:MAG: homoserine kinase [Pseudomonadota bacterium]
MTRSNDVRIAAAPPSVGNMAVGFDVLGHALDAPGDQVRATRIDVGAQQSVVMGKVFGCADRLPEEAANNTAGAGVIRLLEDQRAGFGVILDIYKGIALGSGMGGSAASAVAAVMAANALLKKPLPVDALLPYALAGEVVASGSVHGDNVAPSLLGGIVFVPPSSPQSSYRVPAPDGLMCVLVRPRIRLDTLAGRSLLDDHVALRDAVTQSSHLGRVLCACYTNNIDGLDGALDDVLIEHQRSHQVAGFEEIKHAALSAGALGFSLSGSGPSMVAWLRERDLKRVTAAIRAPVESIYEDRFQWVTSPVAARGARLISHEEWLGE